MAYNYKTIYNNNNLKYRSTIHEIVLTNKNSCIKLYCVKQQYTRNCLSNQQKWLYKVILYKAATYKKLFI